MGTFFERLFTGTHLRGRILLERVKLGWAWLENEARAALRIVVIDLVITLVAVVIATITGSNLTPLLAVFASFACFVVFVRKTVVNVWFVELGLRAYNEIRKRLPLWMQEILGEPEEVPKHDGPWHDASTGGEILHQVTTVWMWKSIWLGVLGFLPLTPGIAGSLDLLFVMIIYFVITATFEGVKVWRMIAIWSFTSAILIGVSIQYATRYMPGTFRNINATFQAFDLGSGASADVTSDQVKLLSTEIKVRGLDRNALINKQHAHDYDPSQPWTEEDLRHSQVDEKILQEDLQELRTLQPQTPHFGRLSPMTRSAIQFVMIIAGIGGVIILLGSGGKQTQTPKAGH